jgi:hypothetical protein
VALSAKAKTAKKRDKRMVWGIWRQRYGFLSAAFFDYGWRRHFLNWFYRMALKKKRSAGKNVQTPKIIAVGAHWAACAGGVVPMVPIVGLG